MAGYIWKWFAKYHGGPEQGQPFSFPCLTKSSALPKLLLGLYAVWVTVLTVRPKDPDK